MEHLDKLIPLAILGGVAGLLVFFLRRTIHHENAALPVEAPTQTTGDKPTPVEEAVTVTAPAPSIVSVEDTPASASPVVVMEKVRKRKVKDLLAPPIAAAPDAMPIVTVLDLLKKKDSLAAAFLLREILAPPVSKRR